MFARFDIDVGGMENQQNKKNKNGDNNATHRVIRRQSETDTPPVTDTVIINTSDIDRIKVGCFFTHGQYCRNLLLVNFKK
jgi:hypothetical protein